MKYQDGEYISLYWDDAPDWKLIKGWHDEKHCQDELINYYGEDANKVTHVEHTYGFWGIGYDEVGDRSQFFYTREKPGRGRFKVTLAHFNGYYADSQQPANGEQA